MAATRLIALHVNKGKTVAQCLADRTDYSQNAAKTNDGEFKDIAHPLNTETREELKSAILAAYQEELAKAE